MQEKPKLCKDCKHCAKVDLTTFYCLHPNNGVNLVTGDNKNQRADRNREDGTLCGEAAKWFEDRPPKPVPPPTTETMYKSGGVYSNNQAKEDKPWYKFWK